MKEIGIEFLLAVFVSILFYWVMTTNQLYW